MLARHRERLVFTAILLTVARVAMAQTSHGPPNTVDPPLVAADSIRNMLVLAGRAVVMSVLATASDAAPVCVSFADGTARYRATVSERRMLSDGHVLDRTDCPATYTNMITHVDSLGGPLRPRPSGYVDPRYVELVLPVQWSLYTVIVQVRVSQGTSIDTYECLRSRKATNQPFSCRIIRRAVS
jgi:hypothetical protein